MTFNDALEVLFTRHGPCPSDIWSSLMSVAKREHTDEKMYNCDNVVMTPADIETFLHHKKHYSIFGKFYDITFCPIDAYDFSLLTIRRHKAAPAAPARSWESWASSIASQNHFINARAFYHEYDFWQNVSDPNEYVTRGRSYQKLPRTSNNLPYPLTKEIVDISQNPGRRVFRPGYLEAVGSVMWISPLFRLRTQANVSANTKIEWLKVAELDCGLLQLDACVSAFTSPVGSQGMIQERLRQLLFPLSMGDVSKN